ncbi:hypothetical protein [Bacillus atrophaeus]|uniref:hypothetical protein n=1 Tax=Bacillus atrophaeus TaxID=1452 RepID=UPI0003313B5B|nr:hypothetical protein [Bacillus atrophaeus]AKL83486.1 hypothetical protein D068_cds07800 [Bacillus atrophaeus UCMB-5137]MDS9998412.1 hypothetical protein [Bacillus atrophaeus]
MVSYRGVIALCLMMFGLLTSIPLYNGTTLGDLVFQLAGLSDWSKKGSHVSAVCGLVLFLTGWVWSSFHFVKKLPAAGFTLLLLSFTAAAAFQPLSEHIVFFIKRSAEGSSAVEYIQPRSYCHNRIEQKKVHITCTLRINHYGKQDTEVAIQPYFDKEMIKPQDVKIKAKTFTLSPRSKTNLNIRFTGISKKDIQMEGDSADMKLTVTNHTE